MLWGFRVTGPGGGFCCRPGGNNLTTVKTQTNNPKASFLIVII